MAVYSAALPIFSPLAKPREIVVIVNEKSLHMLKKLKEIQFFEGKLVKYYVEIAEYSGDDHNYSCRDYYLDDGQEVPEGMKKLARFEDLPSIVLYNPRILVNLHFRSERFISYTDVSLVYHDCLIRPIESHRLIDEQRFVPLDRWKIKALPPVLLHVCPFDNISIF